MTENQVDPQDFKINTGMLHTYINNKSFLHNQTISLNKITKLTQDELDNISIKIAQLFDKSSKSMQQEDLGTLGEYCYDINTINLIKVDDSNLCYMRLGFVVDISGNPRLIEINSQTPSFNFELEEGTDIVLSQAKLNTRDTKYEVALHNCFKDNLLDCAENIDKKLLDCNIGILTCDSFEDIFQANYFKRIIKDLKICNTVEVLTNKHFGFKKTTGKPFRDELGYTTEYDIILNWYPLEFSCDKEDGKYPNGTLFKDLLLKAIENKQVAIFNGIQSFVCQNKYLYNYTQEFFKKDILALDLSKYLVNSFYTEDKVKKVHDDWIGKPIWGRQGNGVFGMKNNVSFRSRENQKDDYYNNQYYIYQENPQLKTVLLEKDGVNTFVNITLEKFVYKTKHGWKAGGQGLRVTSDEVVKDSSQWVVINNEKYV